MSNDAKKPGPHGKLPKGLMIVAAAAIAGFVAVYVSFGPGGNGGGQDEVKTESADAPGQKQPAAKGEGLAALAVGDMSTFVARKEPVALPDFTFNDTGGAPKTLDEWKGKVVLLNLWATWCAPCRKEMPDLDRLQTQLGGDDFEVVAISIDKGDPDKAKAFLEEIKVSNLAFYHDPTAKIGLTFKAYGLPTTLLINREGKEVGRLAGPAHWGSQDAVNLVKAALSDGG